MKKLNLPIQEIIDLYNSGKGCFEIAKQYSCSGATINNLLKSNNVDTKKNPNNYRKYRVNEDYFETIDTEEKAYFLGLLYADGCIYKGTFRLSLQEEDKHILLSFKDQINAEHPLHEIIPKNPKHKKQFLLSVSNKKIINDLLKLGLYENKALKIIYPLNYIRQDLENHFIRGIFDGDGSISSYMRKINNREYISKGCNITGTLDIVTNIGLKIGVPSSICTNNRSFILSISTRKENLIKFYNYLYDEATIFLYRKQDKFKKLIYD